jgi:hypothetical protein
VRGDIFAGHFIGMPSQPYLKINQGGHMLKITKIFGLLIVRGLKPGEKLVVLPEHHHIHKNPTKKEKVDDGQGNLY